MLHIRNLSVSLGGRSVLSDLSLSARPGGVLAICGPNGAGKSTLLRAILGEVSHKGQIALNGIDPTTAPPSQVARMRAVLPQDTQVAFAFTVAEIVRMGHEAGDNGTDTDLVTRALEAVGLAGHADRPLYTLSGGERQRAHLARALAQVWAPVGPLGARWLFLDEPVASLDLGHQLMVLRLARGYADAGGGVVAVMHDLNLTAMLADRVAFLIAGELVALGSPAEVMQADLLERAYSCRIQPNRTPQSGPWVLPQTCTCD